MWLPRIALGKDVADEEPDEPDDEPEQQDPLLESLRRAVGVHAWVAGILCVLLIALNVIRTPELVWWPFPVLGMLAGLAVHWWYGYDRLEEQLRHH